MTQIRKMRDSLAPSTSLCRCHCEERSDVAIRIPCDALHRPLPEGAERERIATSACGLLAMTVVVGTWFYQVDSIAPVEG